MTKPQAIGEGKRPGIVAQNATRQVRAIERADVKRYARISGLLARAVKGDDSAADEVLDLCEQGVSDNITAFSVLKSMEVNDLAGADAELMDHHADKKAKTS